MNAQPSIGFIVVNRAGELSPMMATSDFLKRSEAGIGFWRIRAKSKTVPVSAGGRLQERQGGEAPLLSSPKQPAALANISDPIQGGEPGQPTPATEPSPQAARPKARVAAPSPAVSNPAGGGAKLSKAEKAERNAAIVADYVRGETLSVIRARYGISSDGRIYYIIKAAGVALQRRGSVKKASSPSLPGPREAACHEAVVSEERNPKEDGAPLEGDKVSSGSIATAETPESGGNHARKADVAKAAGERIATPPRSVVKQKFRDWITQRREEMAEASAYLKTHGIIVSVSNPHAEIKMFRLSDRGGQHFHESVLDAARALGWEGLV
jgi:hypothetical protein